VFAELLAPEKNEEAGSSISYLLYEDTQNRFIVASKVPSKFNEFIQDELQEF